MVERICRARGIECEWRDSEDGELLLRTRERCQAVEQQRIVGAGQHDGVGAILAVSDKAGGKLGYDILVAHVVATEGGFGERGEFRRSDQRHFAALREIIDQPPGVFALDGALGAEHRHAFGL